jgi:hypothetical protein
MRDFKKRGFRFLLSLLVASSFLAQGALCAPEENQTTAAAPVEAGEQTLFIKYESLPKVIHPNQIFTLSVSAFLGTKNFSELSSTLNGYKNVTLLNPSLTWAPKDETTYGLSLTMKAVGTSIVTPQISTLLKISDTQSTTSALEGQTINVTPLIPSSNFCGVLAQSLTITGFKIDKYDNTSTIVVLELDGRLANLEDFSIKGVAKQGIDSLKKTLPSGKMFYYLIIPATQKMVQFDYYNTSLESFQTLSVETDASKIPDSMVSTQTDINPKNSNYTLALYLVLCIVIISSAIIFYYQRKPFFFMPIVVSCGLIVYLLYPNEEITLKPQTSVYLVPTPQSTVFMVTQKPTKVKRIKTSDNFTKVLFEAKDQIGWVKNEQLP